MGERAVAAERGDRDDDEVGAECGRAFVDYTCPFPPIWTGEQF
jgi:hypothetical protein